MLAVKPVLGAKQAVWVCEESGADLVEPLQLFYILYDLLNNK
jgi:hypothetical protein